MTGLILNLPNTLTLSRLVAAMFLIALLTLVFPYSKSLALVVFSVAAITDYFDGYLARTRYGVTSFGRLMDPLTDKVMVCAAFVSFVELQLVPAWIAVIIISREFLVTGLRLLAVSKNIIIPAGKWGKHKTVWQIVAIVVILLGLAIQNDVLPAFGGDDLLKSYSIAFHVISYAVSVGVAIITVTSGTMYFVEHRDLMGRNI